MLRNETGQNGEDQLSRVIRHGQLGDVDPKRHRAPVISGLLMTSPTVAVGTKMLLALISRMRSVVYSASVSRETREHFNVAVYTFVMQRGQASRPV